jgi:hypothetical protein
MIYVIGSGSRLWRSIKHNFPNFQPLKRYEKLSVEKEPNKTQLIILSDVDEEDMQIFEKWCQHLNLHLNPKRVYMFSSESVEHNATVYTRRKLLLEKKLKGIFNDNLVIIRLPNLVFPGSRWQQYLRFLKSKKKIYMRQSKYEFRYLDKNDLVDLLKDIETQRGEDEIILNVRSIQLDGASQSFFFNIFVKIICRSSKLKYGISRYTPFFVVGGEEFYNHENKK